MKATDILMQEHRVIERVLTTLDDAALQMEQGVDLRPGFFIDASQFIKGFADGCHHHKEEGVLFKALQETGNPAARGPVNVMLAEHEQGRAYTRAMREAAQRWEAGDASAREQVIENARNYTALLRQHITKEDRILFPIANQVIPLNEQDAVVDGFEHVEHEETGEGVHEKYLALADSLAAELR